MAEILVRIYFDACCLNRPFDDQSFARIRQETSALEHIWASLDGKRSFWVSSEVIEDEIAMAKSAHRREAVALLASGAHEVLSLSPGAIATAQALRRHRIPPYDSLHLGVAFHGGCDFFLTTDDRLIRRAAKAPVLKPMKIHNPITWLAEGYLR